MTTLAFDYSAGPIAPAALKAAGASAVFRYVSTPGNPKNITKAEYEALTAAGIAVGLVYETSATWMLGGYGAGVGAAKAARAQATAAGYPTTHPIWFAADFDTSAHPGSLATVIDALHGCADAEGSKSLVRAYGDYAVIEAAHTAGFTGGWQTVAWSGGIWSAHALVRQTGKTATEAGVQVDVDEDEGPLFPPPPTPPAPAAKSTLEENSMLCYNVPTDAAGKNRAIYQLAGGKYVHVPKSSDYEALMAAGVRTASVSFEFHSALLAAYGTAPAA